jgi:hypothetical protein
VVVGTPEEAAELGLTTANTTPGIAVGAMDAARDVADAVRDAVRPATEGDASMTVGPVLIWLTAKSVKWVQAQRAVLGRSSIREHPSVCQAAAVSSQ